MSADTVAWITYFYNQSLRASTTIYSTDKSRPYGAIMNKNKLSTDNFDLLPLNAMQGHLLSLFQYGVSYFWAHALTAILLVALLWFSYAPGKPFILVWLLSIIGLAAIRWYASDRFKPGHSYSREELLAFGQRYLLFSTILNSLWGVSGAMLLVTDSPMLALHTALLVLVVIAAMPLLLISRPGFYIQIPAILLPLFVILLFQPEPLFRIMALSLLALAGVAILAGNSLFLAINNLQSEQLRMMEQVHTDPVTQLANRRYFEQIYKLEWRRAARNAEPLSLLLIDVDEFKLFNDQHGHQAGDLCLQVIARCAQSVARRAGDIAARYGGEEFILLLPSTPLADALLLAESLRAAVEAQQLEHGGENQHKLVTVSVGVSSCVPSTVQGEHVANSDNDAVVYPAMLLKSADRALYRAKNKGRNRVEHEYCGEGTPDFCYANMGGIEAEAA